MISQLSDTIFRSFLSTKSFHARRRSSQVSVIESGITESLIAGHRQFTTDKKNTSLDDNVGPIIESSATKLESLVKDILEEENLSTLILGVGKSNFGGSDDDEKEIYLHLAITSLKSDDQDDGEGDDKKEILSNKLVLVPLADFSERLAKEFDQQLTSTALCFVADASAAVGTHVIGEILNSCNNGSILIPEPGWMTSLAYFSVQNFISKSKIDRIIFALCRLEAWRVRKHVGMSRTVVFTLPGQSSTAALLPHIQKVFPCERHVFVYDGCVDSTARALRINNTKKTRSKTPVNNGDSPMLPPSLPRSITATTPISPLTSIRDYVLFLSALSANQASAVEAWMSSVDAFLSIKENERTTGYLPFVCRMGYLLADIGRLGNGSVDQSELALANLLQYITGSSSRPLEEQVFEAAKATLKKCRDAEREEAQQYGKLVSEEERVAIEACVFAHKGILIGDKTLLDTVQPSKDWSLKAAKKLTSCLCCAPEDGEGDEEDEERQNSDVAEFANVSGSPTPSGGAGGIFPNMTKSQYVDGKRTFAFDPSKFTGM